MGTTIFNCPQCGGAMETEQKGLRGRLVTCPHCDAQVQVPAPQEEAPPPPPPTPAPPPLAPKTGNLEPGKVIRNIYKIDSKLGESSLGEVYVASVVTDGRKVQLEVLDGGDREDIERLSREIELLASLTHPNIVHVVDAGQDGNFFFLASDYEEGRTLEAILKDGPVDEASALGYTKGVAEALGYAWEQRKILHRDLKPGNIFITSNNVAKLMGFGIAKSSEGQSMGLTGVGFTIGTPAYMSPEQIKAAADLDFRSDIYALGCVLYEILTGGLPFQETAPILLMQKHMDEQPEPVNERNPSVSVECAMLIDKMLRKSRDERQQSWHELVAEIDAVASGPRTIAAVPPAPGEEPAVPKKKGCALGLAAAASLGFATIYLLAKLT